VNELLSYVFSPLREGDIALYRGSGNGLAPILLVAAEETSFGCIERLQHEYALKAELDAHWAARPVALTHHCGRMTLVLEDPGGVPLDRLLGRPLDVSRFLSIAISLAGTLRQMHQRCLVHKDIKPANVLVDEASGGVRLTGFGIASRLPREHQVPAPPEVIAGTLAYMAPEQTGRMNRSVDSRSDLYALGVTYYEMLTGQLPFTAADPMEWVHCHIARQPTPLEERVSGIPGPLSAIVMKLLAKTAEERYQTAAGLEADLQHCFQQWEANGRIDPFLPGIHDLSDQLLIPEKLYGREREIDSLLASFDRVVTTGTMEFVLVSGYSGIGKSSVVNELHQTLVPSRGLYAAGKFDQYKRDIPYATLGQAFQSLVRSLLSRSEAELDQWRDDLREALGSNGQLIVNLVPELGLVIGKQAAVTNLPASDAKNRFQMTFERFLKVFARKEHPLALVLDDLQWLDAATLDLLEHLATQSEVRHLLLVGAYRDNEVNPSHPLLRTLDAVRNAGTSVQEIRLAPLTCNDLRRLTADTLSCKPDDAAPLAQLMHEKTGGNPFFTIQFVSALAEEGLLWFDHAAMRWRWELDRLHAKGYTDNVVDLMVGKLTRLPARTQAALQQLACLGNVAEIAILAIVLGKSSEEISSDLWDAVRLGLVEQSEGSCKFTHDRIQEAAYSLIPERARAEAHLLIGRLLVAHIPAEKREEAAFEIVNQLNRGAALITSKEECEQLAELNLIAGGRAKATTAYASALTHFAAGAALLPEDSWERRHELRFGLELRQAECEFLTGALSEAEQRLDALSTRAATTVERANVVCARIDLYITVGRNARAIAVGLDCLGNFGIHWSPHPTEEEARREYDRIWSQLGSRPIEGLVDLPMMTDPASLATLDVLTKVFAAAMYTEANLACLVICRAVNLSIEHGNCDGSTFAYVMVGAVAGARFNDYGDGLRLGRLGYELVEQRGLRGSQAGVYNQFGTHVLPWTRHFKSCRDLLRRAFEVANRNGDLTFSAYSCHALSTNLLAVGDPLPEVQRQAEDGLAFAEKTRFRVAIDLIAIQLGLIRTLRGLTPKFGSFNDAQFDEIGIEGRLAANPSLARAELSYWIRKLQARFISGDYTSAVNAASRAESMLWKARYAVEAAEYVFYAALSLAAVYDVAETDQRRQHIATLAAHHRQFEIWAKNCPENFEDRAVLVGAEIARIEGRELDAERLYEQAIRSARANGFIHNEALANELASRFYAARGFEKIARVYLQDARHGYLRWGADGKVRQLEQLHPHLRDAPVPASPNATIGAPVQHLDVATVLKAAQAVSGEIVLDKLIERLMRIAVEHAGAERGLLVLFSGEEPQIAAEATTGRGLVDVKLRGTLVSPTELPESLLHYVIRTRETVIIDDALAQNPFSADEYIRKKHVRSILCLPMVKQSNLIGVLYLENNLASHAFTPARISVLELLASQAAISLENARLYNDLQERETRIRRLVDSNIIGIFIGDSRGGVIEANEAFLDMVGYSHEDLISGRIRWTKLTPAEWSSADHDALAQMSATGTCRPFEKEFFRKDGSRVPVLVGGAFFERKQDEGVVFVIDMTDRKRAEEKLRASEQRLLNAQMELAHVNRITTMGQLTASIAHEVNQPLAAVVANADAALRWLDRETPDLPAARRSVEWIIDDGNRASGVIRRFRALANKSRIEKVPLDVNDVVSETVALVRRELISHQVSLRAELALSPPMILGDRVQLQQVIINLVMNSIEAMQSVVDRSRVLVIRSGQDETHEVIVSVTDCGVGISAENAEQLFNAFFTTKSGGMGMGLSICRSIIEAHGGRISATDNLPHGATFQFTFPTIADEAL
jgi:PAS domain S-box-containing protein